MKHIIAIRVKHALASLICLSVILPSMRAYAEQSRGVTGLHIENGWIRGSVTGVSDEATLKLPLKIDCPVPPTSYPAEILALEKRFVSKKQMQDALKAAGQRTQGKFSNTLGLANYSGDWNAPASAALTREEAATQAIRIGLLYFNALGVEVETHPRAVARPYDYDAYIEQLQIEYCHRYSDPTLFLAQAEKRWQRSQYYEKRQPDYTRIDFNLTIDGMRLWNMPSYPARFEDEPDAWIVEPLNAYVIVSDSGVLVESSCTLLERKKQRPLQHDPVYISFLNESKRMRSSTDAPFPAHSGMDALYTFLTRFCNERESGGAEQQLYQNKMMETPVTAFGYTYVVTAIQPCLSMISKDEWAPFWTVEIMTEYDDGWRSAH